jgi:hypothetical protein
MIGTPRYCAPEQMRPLDAVGPSADVYSLGMVLYEMYAGKPFFAGLDNDSIVRRVRDDPTENEPRFARPADPALVALIRKAIAKDRAHRYHNAEEFLRDLEAYRRSLPENTPPTHEPQVITLGSLEEQQIKIILQLQAQTRNAREKALQGGADEWAVALFEQGVTREEDANRRLDDRHYFPAQEAYEEAKRCFERARGEALVLAIQKAEHARRVVGEAKGKAERFNARERAQRLYRDGLSFEDEARGLEDLKQYRQAIVTYEKATSAFEDARERASDALQREIEAEQGRVSEEREAARSDGAEQFAEERFQAARRSEEAAAAALAQAELTRAFALYHTALEQYTHAHGEALRERQRQEAMRARQQTEDSRLKADRYKAEQYAAAPYLRAEESSTQGNTSFETQRYEEAVQAYARAHLAYEQAAQEAEHVQQQQLAVAYQKLTVVRAAADQFDSSQDFPLETAHAQRLAQQGEAHAARQEWEPAIRAYEGAFELFEALKKAATEKRERERQAALAARQHAEAARGTAETRGAKDDAVALYKNGLVLLEEAERCLQADQFRRAIEFCDQAVAAFALAVGVAHQEQGKRSTAAARRQAEEACAAAEQVDARLFFAERFATTSALLDRAEESIGRENFEEATTSYEQAAREFTQLQRDALLQAGQKRAATARQQMNEKKKAVVQLAALAGTSWAQAQATEAQAVRAWTAQDYDQAEIFYQEAERQFAAAGREAEEEQQRQHALAARETAAQMRSAAEALSAPQHAAATYVQALTAWQQAEAQWTAGGWEAAAAGFLLAQELFERARQETQQELDRQAAERLRVAAERAKLRQQAEGARQEALTARAEAIAAQADLGASRIFQQGVVAQEKAEQYVASDDCRQAVRSYQQARSRFAKAVIEARQAQEERAAIAARIKAQAERVAAEQAGALERFPDEYARASQGLARGQSAEEQQDFIQARQCYEQTLHRFDELRKEAILQTVTESIAKARRYVEEVKQRLSTLTEWFGPRWEEARNQEGEAEQAWGVGEYARATELFARAGQTYEAARIEAEARRDQHDANDAQQHALHTRRQAEQSNAPRHAVALYQEAEAAQRQGDQALFEQRWREAKAYFAQASRLFGDAALLAEHEEARLATRRGRQQAESAVDAAREAGAAERLPEEFTAALENMRHGASCEEQEEFAQARELYGDAARRFVGLQERARRQATQEKAEAAKLRCVTAREKNAYLREWAVALWAEAHEWEAQAEQAFQDGDYESAAELYEQARRAYEDAQQAAERERLQREAESAKLNALTAKSEAEKHEAPRYAPEPFAAAASLLADAERQLAAENFVHARDTYQHTVESFSQAVTAAQHERVRLRAIQARRQADEAQAQAERSGAATYYPSEFGEAQRCVAEGQAQETRGKLGAAIDLYTRAAEQFVRVREQTEEQRRAEEEQRRQKATATSQQVQQSQTAADERQAQRYAAEQYQQAADKKQQGEQLLKESKWEEATSHLLEASALFVKVRSVAERVSAQQGAEAARTSAQEAQRNAVGAQGQELFSAQFHEATALIREAEQTFTRESFGDAQALFEKSAHLFRQIERDAVAHAQRMQAEQVQAQALAAQQQVLHVRPRKRKKAEQALVDADQCLAVQRYMEALAKYTEAIRLFEELRREEPKPDTPVVSDRSAKPQSFWKTPTGLGAGLVMLVVAGVVVWIMQKPRPPEDFPSQQAKNQTLNQQQERDTKEPSTKSPSKDAEAKPTPPPLPAPTPPKILSMSPEPSDGLSMDEGAELAFMIEAESAQQKPLRYAWFLDNVKQAEESQWTYRPDFNAGGGKPKEVRVEVTDKDTPPIQERWRIRVQNVNRPPAITETTPKEGAVEVAAGGKQKFLVQASDPDKDDRLTYAWSVDGKEVSRSENGSWQLPETLMKDPHEIAVEVIDKAGAKAAATWNIAALPPPKIEPPRITKSSPELKEVNEPIAVAEGGKITFAVEATSAQQRTLRYTWFLNGKSQSDSPRWTYQPKAGEGDERLKEIRVEVTDGTSKPVVQSWQVRVSAGNWPPAVTTAYPKPGLVDVLLGETKEFNVQATDPNKDDRLAYVWSLDGAEVSRGESRTWRLPTSLTEGAHRVALEIADKAGLKTQVAWVVMTKAPPKPPPRIIAFQPKESQLSTRVGDSLDFLASADTPGSKYQWSVNGAVQGTETGQFRFANTTQAGSYQIVAIAISPEGLNSNPKQWNVEISSPPSSPIITEEEVRDWLETYRRAYEGKNISRLVQLGTLDQAYATQLSQTLAVYQDYHVAVVDVSIRREGANSIVTFKRRDTMDGITQTTALISFSLEKGNDGRISVVSR